MSRKLCTLLIILTFVSGLYAKEHRISPIPPAEQEIINIEPEPCSKACLERLFSEGMVFSFLARFTSSHEVLKKKYTELANLIGLEQALSPRAIENREMSKDLAPVFKVALLIPKKAIGRYATVTIDTILAYLLVQNGDFLFEVFDSIDEQESSIKRTLTAIEAGGYEKVIALMTLEGANVLNRLHSSLDVYVPSVNKNQLENPSTRLRMGGIDYHEQIKILGAFVGGSRVAAFNDSSYVGAKMGQYTRQEVDALVYEETLGDAKTADFQRVIKDRRHSLHNNVVFLNTPLIKTSLLLSQFTLYEIKPSKIFSTQINYNPALLNLTQPRDRDNMFIANSIGGVDRALREQSAILGSDVVYDWINYATSIGIDLFYSQAYQSKRLFEQKIVENQIIYDTQIVQPALDRFVLP